MEHTTEEVSASCTSERIHNIQKRIHAIKSSEKIGVKYMQAWEEKILEQEKAREEGHASGLREGLIQKLKEIGRKESTKRLFSRRDSRNAGRRYRNHSKNNSRIINLTKQQAVRKEQANSVSCLHVNRSLSASFHSATADSEMKRMRN